MLELRFHAALMLCLIAGGEQHAPLSGNRQGETKTTSPRGHFGVGTKPLHVLRHLVFSISKERIVKAASLLRRASSKMLIADVCKVLGLLYLTYLLHYACLLAIHLLFISFSIDL